MNRLLYRCHFRVDVEFDFGVFQQAMSFEDFTVLVKDLLDAFRNIEVLTIFGGPMRRRSSFSVVCLQRIAFPSPFSIMMRYKFESA